MKVESSFIHGSCDNADMMMSEGQKQVHNQETSRQLLARFTFEIKERFLILGKSYLNEKVLMECSNAKRMLASEFIACSQMRSVLKYDTALPRLAHANSSFLIPEALVGA